MHISHIKPEVYDSLFIQSVKGLCLSNKEMANYELKEKINLDTFISLYQELCNDFSNKYNPESTLRKFLLQSAFISHKTIPDSFELKTQINSILGLKKPIEVVKLIFVNSVVIGVNHKQSVPVMKGMIDSYVGLSKQYKQHKAYFNGVMGAFKEVIKIES